MPPYIHSHRFYFEISIIIPTTGGNHESTKAANSIKRLESGLAATKEKRARRQNLCPVVLEKLKELLK